MLQVYLLVTILIETYLISTIYHQPLLYVVLKYQNGLLLSAPLIIYNERAIVADPPTYVISATVVAGHYNWCNFALHSFMVLIEPANMTTLQQLDID